MRMSARYWIEYTITTKKGVERKVISLMVLENAYALYNMMLKEKKNLHSMKLLEETDTGNIILEVINRTGIAQFRQSMELHEANLVELEKL